MSVHLVFGPKTRVVQLKGGMPGINDAVRSNLMPEMTKVSKSLAIMEGGLTVKLFKQVMKGYEITGHNADELNAILADTSKNALTYVGYVSRYDTQEFAKRLSKQTGRKFMILTEEKWRQALDQLSKNNRTCAKTKISFRSNVPTNLPYFDYRSHFYPDYRYAISAVRLAEYLE